MLELPTLAPWSARAACAAPEVPPGDPWCPDDDAEPAHVDEQRTVARWICGTCPVRFECLLDEVQALDRFEPFAMRGGLTPDELRDMAREMGLATEAPQGVRHGNRSTYVGGCRCEECRKAHRVYEHDRRLRSKRLVHGYLQSRLRRDQPRSPRTLGRLTGHKAHEVRRHLDDLVKLGHAQQVGISAQGAPLYVSVRTPPA